MSKLHVNTWTEMLEKIFMIYVHPRLEYALAAWSPHLRKYIEMLVKVQLDTENDARIKINSW